MQVHWGISQGHQIFVFVGKNSSMFTKSPFFTYVSLTICEELSKTHIVDARETDSFH